VDPEVVVSVGASGIADALGGTYPGEIGRILEAYAAALGKVWIITVALACLSVFGVVFPEWRSVKRPAAVDEVCETDKGSV
jgi:hypothetical protein